MQGLGLQGLGLQVAVGCVALVDSEAGFCVWAVGGYVPAAVAGAGSFFGNAVIRNVGALVSTGSLA